MDEYLPSIGIKKGYNNDGYNHQRFSSFDNAKKSFYKNYNKYNNSNYRIKDGINNNNYNINFLKIVNINKDEINSIKNNTAITYYNKSCLNQKLSNNKKLNNIFPETYNNYYQKYKAKKSAGNKPSKSYNNIKVVQGIINNINNYAIKNFNLLLPNHSKPNNNINRIINNSVYNLKSINFFLNNGKLDPKNLVPNTNDNLNNIRLLPKKKNYPFSQTKRNDKITLENQFMKPYKTNNLFNYNNTSNKKICNLCNKEIESYRFKFHINLHPSKIFNWLYLGSYRNACDKQEIKDIGINYVLNCAMECMDNFPVGVEYCHLKFNDMPSFKIIPHLEKATSFINQAAINNGIILVHCQLGISRSTACVIAYMIKYMGYTTMNALDFIKKKRPQVMPNFGFLQQLTIYEKNNKGAGINIDNQNNED